MIHPESIHLSLGSAHLQHISVTGAGLHNAQPSELAA